MLVGGGDFVPPFPEHTCSLKCSLFSIICVVLILSISTTNTRIMEVNKSDSVIIIVVCLSLRYTVIVYIIHCSIQKKMK